MYEKLSLDLSAETMQMGKSSDDEYQDYINKLTSNGTKKYTPVKAYNKYTKNGQYGKVYIDTKNKFIKKELRLVKRNKGIFSPENRSAFNWNFDRLKNFYNVMKKYTAKVRKLFPNNFAKIKNCIYYVDDDDVIIEMNMENISRGKKTVRNFKDDLISKKYNQSQLNRIFAQLYYICVVTNKNNLFHNDLKPGNIIIKKTKKHIYYRGLGNIVLNIKKNSYIPVLIDYDLVSFKNLSSSFHPANLISGYDNIYFNESVKRIIKRFKLHIDLPDIIELPNCDNINYSQIRDVYSKYNISFILI